MARELERRQTTSASSSMVSQIYPDLRNKTVVEAAKITLLLVSALFPIVNPLGGSPVFLTLKRDYSSGARWLLARRIALNRFFFLIGSFLLGTHILPLFGISLSVVQVGGGLIVFSPGWAIVQ